MRSMFNTKHSSQIYYLHWFLLRLNTKTTEDLAKMGDENVLPLIEKRVREENFDYISINWYDMNVLLRSITIEGLLS